VASGRALGGRVLELHPPGVAAPTTRRFAAAAGLASPGGVGGLAGGFPALAVGVPHRCPTDASHGGPSISDGDRACWCPLYLVIAPGCSLHPDALARAAKVRPRSGPAVSGGFNRRLGGPARPLCGARRCTGWTPQTPSRTAAHFYGSPRVIFRPVEGRRSSAGRILGQRWSPSRR